MASAIRNYPLVSCLLCKQTETINTLFLHLINDHTIEGKESLENNPEIKNAVNKQKAMYTRLLYEENPNLCVCGNKKSYNIRDNLYCSQSCAASHSNTNRAESGWSISKESRIKIGQSVIKTNSANSNRYKINRPPNSYIDKETKSFYTPISICDNCKKYFFVPINKSTKNCSDKCVHESRSRSGRNNPGLGTRRSKQEIELYLLCCEEYNSVSSNTKLVDGWDSDIVLHNEKVAVFWNGPWHYKEMKLGKQTLKEVQDRDALKEKLFIENGWTVEIFEDRYYSPESALKVLKSKY